MDSNATPRPAAAGTINYSEPFQRAIELVGKRWSAAILRALLPAPLRFNELLRGIPGISDRILTERLDELERAGLVRRVVITARPIRVAYHVTPACRALGFVFAAVDAWAADWLGAGEDAARTG